jgi:hypothetical protein
MMHISTGLARTAILEVAAPPTRVATLMTMPLSPQHQIMFLSDMKKIALVQQMP